MTLPPLCVWCLRPASDPIHPSHPFIGPRIERPTARELAKAVAAELRQMAVERFGADASAADALDFL